MTIHRGERKPRKDIIDYVPKGYDIYTKGQMKFINVA